MIRNPKSQRPASHTTQGAGVYPPDDDDDDDPPDTADPSFPVAVGLRGDGRVVRLTPRTVRAAFFRFVAENAFTGYDLRPLEDVTVSGTGWRRTTLLDVLFRRHSHHGYLTARQIAAVERFLNAALLTGGRRLVAGEGVIRDGTVVAPGAGRALRPAPFLLRCGLAFELRQLAVPALVAGGVRDIVTETHDREIRVARFLGPRVDRREPGVVLRFADRFDLGVKWEERAAAFRPRRVLAVRRVAACPGFHLDGLHAPVGH